MIRRAARYFVPLGLLLSLVAVPAAVGDAKAKPKSVGTVIAVGGSKKLKGDGGRLGDGANLTLGEQLVMGKGLRATLQLTKPKGAGDEDLVDLNPAKGAELDVAVSRKGSTIIVTISPTASGDPLSNA